MDQKEYSRPLDLKSVSVTDAFWGREQELVRTEVIPYQWEALNDRVPGAAKSFCMRNFRVAGRLMREKRERGADFVPPAYTFRGFEALPEDPENPDPDRFYGFVFQDSDFAKWIEAVGYSLANHPDPELEKTADEAIDVVCAAQVENGYLDTYYIINGMDRIFTNLRDHHELYCFGHLVEGAVAYFQATGKDKLLRAAERYADFIASRFGEEPGKNGGYPGHEIAEMALARLYELTGEKKYLKLAEFFIRKRGTRPYYFDLEDRERAQHEGRVWRAPEGWDAKPGEEAFGKNLRFHYHQAHLPVERQSEAVGHAVRAVYLYSGMADVARLTGDEAMFAACERIWDNIVNRKLYITGGIGGTHVGEAFSFDYDLPNDTAYSETCAAIGLAFFARRMLEIRADHRYGDVMEQALYNTVLSGMALDGRSFFYVNPLEVLPEACREDERKRHVKSVRQKWFGCACCPPNIARIVSSVGSYAYTAGPDTLYTHLFLGSSLSFPLGGRTVDMRVESGFPWEGKVRVTLHMEGAAEGTLAFRIPGWCGSMTAQVREETERGDQKRADVAQAEKKAAHPGRAVMTARAERGRKGRMREPLSLAVTSGEEVSLGQGSPAKSRRMAARLERGYLYLTGEWRDGDEIFLDLPLEVRCVAANTGVREDIGKVAFLRGPVCYCMEEADNGKDLHLLRADLEKAMSAGDPESRGESFGERPAFPGVRVESFDGLGHEMRVLKVPGFRQEASEENAPLYQEYAGAREKETTLTFVPYYAWNNRGEGEMSVWVRR